MIGSSILSVIVTLVISLLFCKMFYELQKRKKEAVNMVDQSSSTVGAMDSTLQTSKEPLYEDIELTDKTNTTGFSKNVAYACIKN